MKNESAGIIWIVFIPFKCEVLFSNLLIFYTLVSQHYLSSTLLSFYSNTLFKGPPHRSLAHRYCHKNKKAYEIFLRNSMKDIFKPKAE